MRINLSELRQIVVEALLNAYAVLGVSPNASDEEIKAAWKKLALQHHPDRGGSHGKMVDINNAKDRLLNKANLFRHGATFKGYEDPNAPRVAQPPPAERPWPKDVPNWNDPNRGRRASGENPAPGPGAGRGYDADFKHKQKEHEQGAGKKTGYYTFVGGRSYKFWEITVQGRVTTVRWGRIGTPGQTNRIEHPSDWEANVFASKSINAKLDKGYRRSDPNVHPPRGDRPAQSGPIPKREPSGQPRKDTYKVYPWRNARRVVRVGGKLYGTDMGGKLRDGGQTKFQANDRARVSPENGRMRVSKADSDHSQVWDQIGEVRMIVDDLVADMLVEIASR